MKEPRTESARYALRLAPAIVALFFVLCWAFFFFVWPSHLYFKEQITLFSTQCTEMMRYAHLPASVAALAGDYLTQFFLLVGGGATILTAALLLLWWGVRNALRRLGAGRNAQLWALLPVASEWVLSCRVEYPLSMTLAVAICVWCFVAWSAIRNTALRRTAAFAITLLLYPIAGARFALFTLPAIIYEGACRRSWLTASALLATAAALPWLASLLYPLTAAAAAAYPIPYGYLPGEHFAFLATEILLLFAILLARSRTPRWVALTLLAAGLPAALGAVCDRAEAYTLRLSCDAYFGRWERIIEAERGNERHKTHIAAACINLAHARAGELPDALLDRYQPGSHGLLLTTANRTYPYHFAAVEALMECGDMAQAQHAALVGMTFSPWQRSSRMVRRLAEAALVNGDRAVAEKYLRLLTHTSLHARWARQRLPLLRSDSLCAATPWVARLRALIPTRDTLMIRGDWGASLGNLLESNPANRTAADYLLCILLLDKDLPGFGRAYERYYAPLRGGAAPPLYRQALAMLFDPEQPGRYPVDAATLRQMGEYIELASAGRTQELRERFARSYWFYYDFATLTDR